MVSACYVSDAYRMGRRLAIIYSDSDSEGSWLAAHCSYFTCQRPASPSIAGVFQHSSCQSFSTLQRLALHYQPQESPGWYNPRHCGQILLRALNSARSYGDSSVQHPRLLCYTIRNFVVSSCQCQSARGGRCTAWEPALTTRKRSPCVVGGRRRK